MNAQGSERSAMLNRLLEMPARGRFAVSMTWLMAPTILTMLAVVVISRQGNLAWDDADYLRRGLANAREAESAGGLKFVLRGLECLLHEGPKPPWLVAWIQAGAMVFGRNNLDYLIIYASVVPYAFLLVAVIGISRWLNGEWGGLLALVCLVSSPYSLDFGAKVMVETYLSLWVLLTYALAARLLARPTRRCGLALGTMVGLSLLTKLTTALFLPAPLVYVLFHAVRPSSDRRRLLNALVWSGLISLVIAGPWYALNTVKAVKFAIFSSQYDQVTGDRADRVPTGERVAAFVGDLPGRPLAATFAGATLFGSVLTLRKCNRSFDHLIEQSDHQAHLARMTWLGAGTGAAVLLLPSYFDSRFLLPIWPLLAIELGRRFAIMMTGFTAIPRSLVSGGLAASVLLACASIVGQPSIPTYWRTASLIDHLVSQYGVATLGNVGNCIEWNVCKTSLINELRKKPADCFVRHDLTRLPPERIRQVLTRFDAVVVLRRTDLPESRFVFAPGLNRSYGAVVENVTQDHQFVLVPTPMERGLPHLAVYVKKSKLGPIEQWPKTYAGNHRLWERPSRPN
jgi:4-amino-4-deoxy-L-arabinose transferase-like glycosyltransferase